MNVNYMAKPMQNTVPYKDWNRLILEKNSLNVRKVEKPLLVTQPFENHRL